MARDDAQAVALTEELGAQLRRMKGAGAKVLELLSMVALDREPPPRDPVSFARVRGVVEVVAVKVQHPDSIDAELRDIGVVAPILGRVAGPRVQRAPRAPGGRRRVAARAIAAEHHAGEPAATALGREDRAFFQRRR